MTLTQHERIAYQFAAAREAAGKTQAEVAKHLGVTYQAISNWERGQTKIDSVSLLRALKFFGTNVYDFFESCGFNMMQPMEDVPASKVKAPSLSDEAMRVAAAYDRADDRTKQVVDLTLEPFMEKKTKAKIG